MITNFLCGIKGPVVWLFFYPSNISIIACRLSWSDLGIRSCRRVAVLVAQSLRHFCLSRSLCVRNLNVILMKMFLLALQALDIWLSLRFYSISWGFYHCISVHWLHKPQWVALFWSFFFFGGLLFLPSLLWLWKGQENSIELIKNWLLEMHAIQAWDKMLVIKTNISCV